jgi:hypothetical protein
VCLNYLHDITNTFDCNKFQQLEKLSHKGKTKLSEKETRILNIAWIYFVDFCFSRKRRKFLFYLQYATENSFGSSLIKMALKNNLSSNNLIANAFSFVEAATF